MENVKIQWAVIIALCLVCSILLWSDTKLNNKVTELQKTKLNATVTVEDKEVPLVNIFNAILIELDNIKKGQK